MTVKLWNELNDQQAEKVSGGSGQDVVNVMNPTKDQTLFNYGQFLKRLGLSAKEANEQNLGNPVTADLGSAINDIATS